MEAINTPLAQRTPTAQAGGARRQGVFSFGVVVNLWLL